MIFYFSGTGNSLDIAKRLARNLGETGVYSMAKEPMSEQIGGRNEIIGFVFPSYFGNLPRIVGKFISVLNIHPETYVYGVVTMGAFGQGSVAALEKALAEKGIKLHYGCGIRMPANYIISYNPMLFGRAGTAEKRIKRISDEIAAKKATIKKSSFIFDTLYKNIEQLDEKFYTDDKCTGCGKCEDICPVANIRLTDGKPRWQHHCEHCMACIHWCPQKAIQYGEKTPKRRRYQNPNVDISEMK